MSLRFPLVFWNEAPEMSYTCCIVTLEPKRLVAGTECGLCVLWELGKKKKYHAEPFAVMSGHEIKVVTMCEILFDYSTCVASVSLDGTLCLWNVKDGRCMSLQLYLFRANPTCLRSLPGETHIACSGMHNVIEIADLKNFVVVRTLNLHQNWITSLSCGNITSNENKDFCCMLSIGKDQNLTYWYSPGGSCHLMQAHATVTSASLDPLWACHSPDWKWVAIIESQLCSLFHFQGHIPIYQIESPPELTFEGALFLDARHLLVYTSHGTGCLYQLPVPDYNPELVIIKPETPKSKSVPASPNPKSSLSYIDTDQSTEKEQVKKEAQSPSIQDFWKSFGKLFSKKKDDPKGAEVKEILSFESESSDGSVDGSRREKSEIRVVRDTHSPILMNFKGSSGVRLCKIFEVDGSNRNFEGKYSWSFSKKFLMRADYMGNIKIWLIELPDVLDSEDTQLELKIKEISTSTLASGWPSRQTDKRHQNEITASRITVDTDKSTKLIRGFKNGQISIISPGDQNDIEFQGHSSRITSLLVLTDSSRNRRILVSGSMDGSVKLWNLQDGILLKEFYIHSGRIELLFTPPDAVRKKLQNCFISLGDDRSIVLYSVQKMEVLHVFGGHSTSIINVYWRIDLDYTLVRCCDDTLYVWHIHTGLLERIVVGNSALHMIDSLEGIGASKRPTVNIRISKNNLKSYPNKKRGYMETHSIPVSRTEADIQILVLSVRRLIGYINAKRETVLHMLQTTEHSSLKTSLAYLFQYGKSNTLVLLRKMLNISTAYPTPNIGLKGTGSTFSLIVPKASKKSHPFKFSPVLSSIHTISCIAVLTILSRFSELKQICLEVIRYFLYDLPNDFEVYEDPSFLFSAQFLKDPSPEIQSAAKAVMNALLSRMDTDQIESLGKKLASILTQDKSSNTNSKKRNVIVALAMLTSHKPKAVTGRIACLTAMGLLDILEAGGPQQLTAISLLGEGFHIWQYYLPDFRSFIQKLFTLSLKALSGQHKDYNTMEYRISYDALQALVNVAQVDPKLYVRFIGSLTENPGQQNVKILKCAISSFDPVMQRHPLVLIDHLVAITGILLQVLDPHFPNIRNQCFETARGVLKRMIDLYPMVSYHHTKQKFAVGSSEGILIIYDLRTASKWQLIEGHKGPVCALSINPKGEYIASYSTQDFNCRIWSIDGAGVLNLLGVISRSIRTYEIPKSVPLKGGDIFKCQIYWDNPKKFTLELRDQKMTFSL